MNPRLAKQIIYTAGYLAVFSAIILGIYFIWLKPAPTCSDNRQNQSETGVDCGGPCEPCEIRTLSPLRTSWVRHFSTGLEKSIDIRDLGNQTIIAAEIQNPNQNYAAREFTYSLNVYGKDRDLMKTIKNKSFIYAGEIKYLIESTDADSNAVGEVKLEFADFIWKPTGEFSEPEIQTREIRTAASSLKNVGAEVSGIVINNNPFPVPKMKIIALLRDRDERYLMASKTELENVASYREANFKISFPANVSLAKPPLPTAQTFIFGRDLTIGSTGKDVVELQKFLKSQGLFEREPTDYFGNITKEALINYQKKVGISPASGYFGQKTRDDINAQVPKATPPQTSLTEADPSKTKIYVESLR